MVDINAANLSHHRWVFVFSLFTTFNISKGINYKNVSMLFSLRRMRCAQRPSPYSRPVSRLQRPPDDSTSPTPLALQFPPPYTSLSQQAAFAFSQQPPLLQMIILAEKYQVFLSKSGILGQISVTQGQKMKIMKNRASNWTTMKINRFRNPCGNRNRIPKVLSTIWSPKRVTVRTELYRASFQLGSFYKKRQRGSFSWLFEGCNTWCTFKRYPKMMSCFYSDKPGRNFFYSTWHSGPWHETFLGFWTMTKSAGDYPLNSHPRKKLAPLRYRFSFPLITSGSSKWVQFLEQFNRNIKLN